MYHIYLSPYLSNGHRHSPRPQAVLRSFSLVHVRLHRFVAPDELRLPIPSIAALQTLRGKNHLASKLDCPFIVLSGDHTLRS